MATLLFKLNLPNFRGKVANLQSDELYTDSDRAMGTDPALEWRHLKLQLITTQVDEKLGGTRAHVADH